MNDYEAILTDEERRSLGALDKVLLAAERRLSKASEDRESHDAIADKVRDPEGWKRREKDRAAEISRLKALGVRFDEPETESEAPSESLEAKLAALEARFEKLGG